MLMPLCRRLTELDTAQKAVATEAEALMGKLEEEVKGRKRKGRKTGERAMEEEEEEQEVDEGNGDGGCLDEATLLAHTRVALDPQSHLRRRRKREQQEQDARELLSPDVLAAHRALLGRRERAEEILRETKELKAGWHALW